MDNWDDTRPTQGIIWFVPYEDNEAHSEAPDHSSTCTRSEIKREYQDPVQIRTALPSFLLVEAGACGQSSPPGRHPPPRAE